MTGVGVGDGSGVAVAVGLGEASAIGNGVGRRAPLGVGVPRRTDRRVLSPSRSVCCTSWYQFQANAIRATKMMLLMPYRTGRRGIWREMATCGTAARNGGPGSRRADGWYRSTIAWAFRPR